MLLLSIGGGEEQGSTEVCLKVCGVVDQDCFQLSTPVACHLFLVNHKGCPPCVWYEYIVETFTTTDDSEKMRILLPK
jgi:hypothetical protein